MRPENPTNNWCTPQRQQLLEVHIFMSSMLQIWGFPNCVLFSWEIYTVGVNLGWNSPYLDLLLPKKFSLTHLSGTPASFSSDLHSVLSRMSDLSYRRYSERFSPDRGIPEQGILLKFSLTSGRYCTKKARRTMVRGECSLHYDWCKGASAEPFRKINFLCMTNEGLCRDYLRFMVCSDKNGTSESRHDKMTSSYT